MKVTGDQVRTAVEAAKIDHVDHHACTLCGYMTKYAFSKGKVFFDPGCWCRGEQAYEPRTWDSVAAWINMQDRPDIRAALAKQFSITTEDGT